MGSSGDHCVGVVVLNHRGNSLALGARLSALTRPRGGGLGRAGLPALVPEVLLENLYGLVLGLCCTGSCALACGLAGGHGPGVVNARDWGRDGEAPDVCKRSCVSLSVAQDGLIR